MKYWIGAALFIIGSSLMMKAMYEEGKNDARAESVWTEADKLATDNASTE